MVRRCFTVCDPHPPTSPPGTLWVALRLSPRTREGEPDSPLAGVGEGLGVRGNCKAVCLNLKPCLSRKRSHMATVSSLPLTARRSLVRPIVLGGMFIFISQIIHQWITVTLLQGNPFILVWQYIASAILGNAAFEGGIATALLGVFIHLIISLVIAGVFILSADRIPLLRRHPIASSLLYGFGVFVVMNM